MTEPRPVKAYIADWDIPSEDWDQIEATIRPIRNMTSAEGSGAEGPGIVVDVLAESDDDPALAIEIGVEDLLPVIEEAARMWYDDEGIEQPAYLADPADTEEPPVPKPPRLCYCAECSAARSCAADGCKECRQYLDEGGCNGQ